MSSISFSNQPQITIESAQTTDLPAIIELCVAAFTKFEVFGPPWNSDAGLLPAILAGSGDFDPALSRIARHDGVIVGHALWSECMMHLPGGIHQAAHLAPLSVHPAWQGHGIGSQLMRDGIELLRSRGNRMLFILGHDFYYPRFGLLTSCHGRHGAIVPLPDAVTVDQAGWTLRPIRLGDEQPLRTLWERLCATVIGATPPARGLLPWCSKTKDIIACCLEHKGTIMAYARVDFRSNTPTESRLLRFLATDAESAAYLLGRLKAWGKWEESEQFVPLPLSSPAVRRLFSQARDHHERWPAGMAMALDDEPVLQNLLEDIHNQKKAPLFIEWPNLFDW